MSTTLSRLFFRTTYLAPSTGTILKWWESRRPVYNMAVGAAGLASLTVISIAEMLTPGRSPMGAPWLMIAFYAFLANLCYCLGPFLDVMIVKRWGQNYSAVGPALFRYGFAFAVGLTLLPIPLVTVGVFVRLLLGVG